MNKIFRIQEFNSVNFVHSVKNPSNFRLDAAGAGETPAAQGFVDGEESGDNKDQPQPQHKIHEDDSGDEAKRPDDASGDTTVALDVWPEEFAHAEKFSIAVPRGKLRTDGYLRSSQRGGRKATDTGDFLLPGLA